MRPSNQEPERKRRIRNGQRGHTFVETALIILPYLAIVLGTFEIAHILFMYQSLIERARLAVRTATVTTWDATSSPAKVQNVILFGQTTVPDGVTNPDVGWFNLRRSSITVTANIAGTNDDRITVEIRNYTFTFATAMLIAPSSLVTLPARPIIVTMPYEVPPSA